MSLAWRMIDVNCRSTAAILNKFKIFVLTSYFIVSAQQLAQLCEQLDSFSEAVTHWHFAYNMARVCLGTDNLTTRNCLARRRQAQMIATSDES